MVKILPGFQSCAFPTFMVPHSQSIQKNCYFYFVALIYFINWSIIAFNGASLMVQTVKNLPTIQENPGLIPGLGRSSGEENGYSLQYSCLENSRATVHGVAKSWAQLSD